MDGIYPENSNGFFYKNIATIFSLKNNLRKQLDIAFSFRENMEEVQHGMLHSHGLHIDALIAALLFENGYFPQSRKMLSVIRKQHFENSLTEYYTSLFSEMPDTLNSEKDG